MHILHILSKNPLPCSWINLIAGLHLSKIRNKANPFLTNTLLFCNKFGNLLNLGTNTAPYLVVPSIYLKGVFLFRHTSSSFIFLFVQYSFLASANNLPEKGPMYSPESS